MKRSVFLIVATIMVVTSCKELPQEKTTSLADFTPSNRFPITLKGQVKSYQIRTFWAEEVNGSIEKGSMITTLERDSLNLAYDYNLFFDEDGILTKTEWILKDGQFSYWDLESMDNKFVKATWYVRGESRYYWTFIYDDLGKMVERNRYRSGVDTLLFRQVATYYENGLRKDLIGYNADNEQIGRGLLRWNDFGQVTESLYYNASGEITNEVIITYDEKGNQSSKLWNTPALNGIKFEYKDLIFDNIGNLESYVTYRIEELFSFKEVNIEYY